MNNNLSTTPSKPKQTKSGVTVTSPIAATVSTPRILQSAVASSAGSNGTPRLLNESLCKPENSVLPSQTELRVAEAYKILKEVGFSCLFDSGQSDNGNLGPFGGNLAGASNVPSAKPRTPRKPRGLKPSSLATGMQKEAGAPTTPPQDPHLTMQLEIAAASPRTPGTVKSSVATDEGGSATVLSGAAEMVLEANMTVKPPAKPRKPRARLVAKKRDIDPMDCEVAQAQATPRNMNESGLIVSQPDATLPPPGKKRKPRVTKPPKVPDLAQPVADVVDLTGYDVDESVAQSSVPVMSPAPELKTSACLSETTSPHAPPATPMKTTPKPRKPRVPKRPVVNLSTAVPTETSVNESGSAANFPSSGAERKPQMLAQCLPLPTIANNGTNTTGSLSAASRHDLSEPAPLPEHVDYLSPAARCISFANELNPTSASVRPLLRLLLSELLAMVESI
eukprot:ANDGO_07759.mRNA.1 hypothetical protein